MVNFCDLPTDLKITIFTRVPAGSIGDCKLVSKSWNQLLHPDFHRSHSSFLLSNLDSAIDSGKLGFIFRMYDGDKSNLTSLYYLEYDDESSSVSDKKLKLESPFNTYTINGSCNGLLCLVGLPNHYPNDSRTGVFGVPIHMRNQKSRNTASYVAYICNPMTGESVTLPELDRSTYCDVVDSMSYGIGYVASTNEFKVVRIYNYNSDSPQRKQEKIFAEIEVYTLGIDKAWRNVGKIPEQRNSLVRRGGGVIDGMLYWTFNHGKIKTFDMETEIVIELDAYYKKRLENSGVLGGHYCQVDPNFLNRTEGSDVWLLKNKEDGSFSWSKEFSLPRGYGSTPLALTKSGKLLWYSRTKFYLYDPNSGSSELLRDFGREAYSGVPHMNTFINPNLTFRYFP